MISAKLVVPLHIKDVHKMYANFPACGDDVFGCDGGPLDELADKLEADAPRGSCDEDTTCEHSAIWKVSFPPFGSRLFTSVKCQIFSRAPAG